MIEPVNTHKGFQELVPAIESACVTLTLVLLQLRHMSFENAEKPCQAAAMVRQVRTAGTISAGNQQSFSMLCIQISRYMHSHHQTTFGQSLQQFLLQPSQQEAYGMSCKLTWRKRPRLEAKGPVRWLVQCSIRPARFATALARTAGALSEALWMSSAMHT